MGRGMIVLFAAAVAALVAVSSPARSGDIPAITVDSLGDLGDLAPGDGSCLTDNSLPRTGKCTLRAAIQEANANDREERITFASGLRGKIALPNGELQITNDLANRDLVISGPGPRTLTVSGNGASRVFNIGTDATVEISGLSIADGRDSVSDDEGGAGIMNRGTLTLRNSAVVRNTLAVFDDGAGIFNSGTLSVENTTVSNNRSRNNGGGISSNSNGDVTLTNSTVTLNAAADSGGGINNTGAMTLTNSTLSHNTTDAPGRDDDIDGQGGGISTFGSADTVTLLNTIVARNEAGIGPDAHGEFVSRGYNLIGNNGNASGFNSFDLLNRNPRLGPLQNNGGPTNTRALLSESPAIDRGTNTDCPTVDQRLIARPQNGDGKRGSTCDIGAYEKKRR